MGGIRTKLKILTMILIVIVITTSILPLILTLDISLQNLNRQIVVEQQELFILILISAITAVILGIIGAFLVVTSPLDSIENLIGKVIEIGSEESPSAVETDLEKAILEHHQMIGRLLSEVRDSRNSMKIAGEVQKRFIPLNPAPHSEAYILATIGREANENLEMFGYYEGAEGLSGDYFSFTRISPDTYAMIIADVSGKDTQAALLMVVIATLFIEHLPEWAPEKMSLKQQAAAIKRIKPGLLTMIAHRMNEIIYRRHFQGKFVAFTMLTLNEKSGDITFCSAGDESVSVYRQSEQRTIQLQLPRTPAAGVFGLAESKMFRMPLDFPEQQDKLHPGDILFLITDGFEESRRYLRDLDWDIITEADVKVYENGQQKDRRHELEKTMPGGCSHVDNIGIGEEFTRERIHAVIDAAMNRQVYRLQKFKNPIRNDELLFDFRKLDPSPENAVLALLSVEKIFRLVPRPGLGPTDRIRIDSKIDDFLKETFMQYEKYFSHPHGEDDSGLYRFYHHISEDSQYDDLAILAIKKLIPR
jgi:serine phosphatase RsbU (regulator of sigma subunit)